MSCGEWDAISRLSDDNLMILISITGPENW